MFPRSDGQRLSTLREPTYTGANRCIPCTVVNLVLAAALAVAVAAVWPPLAPVVALLSLASIYLRGYLVPGTPTLTKRYLPDRMLAWFGKPTERSRTDRGDRGPRLTTDLGPESALREAGVLETVPANEADEADGTRLSSEFRTAWVDALEALETADVADGVRATFGDAAETTPVGGDLTTVVDGERLVGWETDASLRADIAAAELLATRDADWETLGGPDRQELLSTLRAYLDRCPDCGGTVELTESLVESCCRPADRTVTAQCVDCGTMLLDVGERA
ncbi:hypothetical protein [Halolamina salifodinae]|uniref:Uncharacterized protein n=1 Tax=Halolamina salifodinae TaxID=1202767 RepID=A0A8T4GTS1_9EURY|nr:hypothetical protein [Halolamina salifodinae]MBP1986246.1 hypothetical protein [Halolamina salifodinae]